VPHYLKEGRGLEGEVDPVKIKASDTIPLAGQSRSSGGRLRGTQPSAGNVGPADVQLAADSLGTHPVLIKDPLTEVTRRERRTFLGVSILAIAVIKANLIPNRLTAFGVEIDHVRHEALVTVLTAIVLYFLFVFVAYAFSDFLGWRIAFWEARRASAVEGEKAQKAVDEGADEDSPEVAECYRRQRAWSQKAIPTSAVRAFLDFGLPVLVGVTALMVLRGCA
jgi:hypothetical protein